MNRKNQSQLYEIHRNRINKKHIKSRASDRYGIDLTSSKRKKIMQMIDSGNCVYLKPGSLPGRKVYSVVLEGTDMEVVYDTCYRCLVTVLTKRKDDGWYR